ncbi:hypothetical protein L210DRAFT_290522 [Boletus edulis BED1]|uniref:Uncharacterized protein n=1 Tax=Boletus edulis BED1 TaxID=1328754 RepID=A0AAD4C5Z2_BOLED|nr:hypothetical protein L210DRAFT_290522 [Boletus edulis BED1]
MLKVWKDSSSQSHLTHLGSWQDCEPGEIGVDSPTALLETSSAGLTPELDLNTVSLKRARQTSNQDTSNTHFTWSSKRAKTSHRKHSSFTPSFTSASADELLEFAKARNTIVIHSRSDDVTDLSSEFLTWVAESLTASPNRGSSCPQVSIVVVP